MTESLHAAIRGVFRTAGGMSTVRLAQSCMMRGVFPDEWKEAAAMTAAQSECRKALKDADSNGLPFAGRTGRRDKDGGEVWEQREFWSYGTYELNIGENVKQRNANHEKALLLWQECRAKYQQAPDIPGIDAIDGQRGAA